MSELVMKTEGFYTGPVQVLDASCRQTGPAWQRVQSPASEAVLVAIFRSQSTVACQFLS